MTLHFLGIGAQKAGTTWLFEKLREHPSLSFPGGKEVHFWDTHSDRGLNWYRATVSVEPHRLIRRGRNCLGGRQVPANSLGPRPELHHDHRRNSQGCSVRGRAAASSSDLLTAKLAGDLRGQATDGVARRLGSSPEARLAPTQVSARILGSHSLASLQGALRCFRIMLEASIAASESQPA